MTQEKTTSLFAAILKLTRWQEFFLFTLVLTLMGGLIPYRQENIQLDWKLLVVFGANLCAMAYAFMINDIEDAQDDAYNPHRGSRNPITSGELSKPIGWIAAITCAVLAFIGYAIVDSLGTFLIGSATVILAHLYSWKVVRLKARPLVDILSHATMLSTFLFLAPFFAYTSNIGAAWAFTLGTFLISANGQLYNQVRDYDADQAAGLHNTASILGKTLTDILAKSSIAGFVLSLVITAIQGIFPVWLGLAFAVAIPIGWFLGRSETDMRGQKTDDPMARIQLQALLIFNITLLIWLGEALFF